MSASVWKKCRLGSLGDAIIGLTYSPANIVESGTLVLRSSNIQDDRLSLEDSVYVNKQISDEIRIRYNDILICVRNGSKALIGKSLLLKNECVGETFGAFMTVFRSEYAEFLTHVIKSSDIKKQIVRCTGATINQITNGDLKQFTLYFPTSSDERNRISKTLSTCDTVIQNTQKTIEKYKAIKQGMMQDLFTRGLTKDGKLRPSYEEDPELYKQSELGMIPKEWEVKTIGECADLSSGNTPSRENESNFLGSIRWVTSGELKQKYLQETIEKISTQAIKKHSLKLYESGTVVIAIYGLEAEGTRGSCSILSKSCTISQACLAFSNFKFTNNEYLYYWYLLNGKTVGLKYAQGTKQQNLASETVSNLKIKFPDLTEQIAIAKRLSSIDSTIQKEEAILAKYKNIKTGLMARLLTPPEDAQIIDETEE